MREVRGFFIELEPAKNTMVLEIFCHFGFADSQVIGKSASDWAFAAGNASATTAAGKLPQRDA